MSGKIQWDSAGRPELNWGETLNTVIFVNFWARKGVRIDRVVGQASGAVTNIRPESASTVFSCDEPEAVLVAFEPGSREAATFIADYKSSAWFRRIPLIALVDSRDESMMTLCMNWGCDDALVQPIRTTQLRARLRMWRLRNRMRKREREATDRAVRDAQRAAEFADVIVPLGVAMMAETAFDALLNSILSQARRFCNADGGTFYLLDQENQHLEFKLIFNESMGIEYSERNRKTLPFDPLPLPLEEPKNHTHIACHVARTGETILVDDVYADGRFDFSGTHEFDDRTGYRTRSLLTIALRERGGRIVGVLQLVNAMDPATRHVIAFDPLDRSLMESMSLMAGQALESYRRMAQLRKEADALTIDIDESEKSRQVSAITDSDYFKQLKAKAHALREQAEPMESSTSA